MSVLSVSAKGFYQEQTVVPGFLCEILDVKPHNLEDCRFEPDRRKLEKAIRGELLCFLFSNHYHYKYLCTGLYIVVFCELWWVYTKLNSGCVFVSSTAVHIYETRVVEKSTEQSSEGCSLLKL